MRMRKSEQTANWKAYRYIVNGKEVVITARDAKEAKTYLKMVKA